jgi:ATP-dependent helicase/DNAse subunit B
MGEKPFYFRACELLRGRQAAKVFTPYDGILSGVFARETLKKEYALQDVPVSASRLETFAACPLRYFYKYVLRLTIHPDPEKVLQLQASDRGNLMHDILEKTLKRGLSEGWVEAKDSSRGASALEEEMERAFKRFEREGVPGALGLWLWEREQMRSDLRRVLEGVLSDSDWVPLAFEIGFGNRGGEESVEVVFDAGTDSRFRLQGRMDRVDVSKDGQNLRVVDYKSGSAGGAAKNSVKGGKKLQLPFYLWALKNIYPQKTAKEALYDFITRKGSYRQVEYDPEKTEGPEKVLGQVLSTVSRGVEGGLFPAVGRECDQCDYRGLCGTGMKGRGERKQEDAQTKDYYALENLK